MHIRMQQFTWFSKIYVVIDVNFRGILVFFMPLKEHIFGLVVILWIVMDKRNPDLVLIFMTKDHYDCYYYCNFKSLKCKVSTWF